MRNKIIASLLAIGSVAIAAPAADAAPRLSEQDAAGFITTILGPDVAATANINASFGGTIVNNVHITSLNSTRRLTDRKVVVTVNADIENVAGAVNSGTLSWIVKANRGGTTGKFCIGC